MYQASVWDFDEPSYDVAAIVEKAFSWATPEFLRKARELGLDDDGITTGQLVQEQKNLITTALNYRARQSKQQPASVRVIPAYAQPNSRFADWPDAEIYTAAAGEDESSKAAKADAFTLKSDWVERDAAVAKRARDLRQLESAVHGGGFGKLWD
jgi:hypothetical protein